MIAQPDFAPTSGRNGMKTLHLSVAGGLTQFGAYIETLEPGGVSSDRHWHDAEDEFLFVLEGTPTVTDNAGPQALVRGDAVCWPYGVPNAHQVKNLSDRPCQYLIVGSRVAGDVCHYPDTSHRQVNGSTHWQVLNADGTVVRHGPLPPELLGLPPVWGVPDQSGTRSRVLRGDHGVWTPEDAYVHPILGGGLGSYDHIILGDAGGLSQFGVHLERLPPGSGSSHRHWHEAEDEMVLVLSGQPTLIEEQDTPLHPGDMACWAAGVAMGHRLDNRSDAPVVYLTVGTRRLKDTIHYPDQDLITRKDGAARVYSHADGRQRTP